jgi:hypothetical protein
MNFQQEQLKNSMVRDKLFLKELYEGQDLEQKRRILNFGSDLKVHSRNKYLFNVIYFAVFLSLLKRVFNLQVPKSQNGINNF